MTPRQTELVTFIRTFIAEHGYPPSIREMLGHPYAAHASVSANLHLLRNMGVLTFEGGLARTIRLIEAASSPPSVSAAALPLPAAAPEVTP